MLTILIVLGLPWWLRCNYSKDFLHAATNPDKSTRKSFGRYFASVVDGLESFCTNLPAIGQPVLYGIYILYLIDILQRILVLLTNQSFVVNIPWVQRSGRLQNRDVSDEIG